MQSPVKSAQVLKVRHTSGEVQPDVVKVQCSCTIGGSTADTDSYLLYLCQVQAGVIVFEIAQGNIPCLPGVLQDYIGVSVGDRCGLRAPGLLSSCKVTYSGEAMLLFIPMS